MAAAVFTLANGITAQAFNTIIQLKCAVFGKDTNKNKMKSHFLKQGILTIKLIIISLIFSFSSCNKDEMDNNETVINDNYYVEYVIIGNGTYGRFSNWTATTPQGIYTNSGYQASLASSRNEKTHANRRGFSA